MAAPAPICPSQQPLQFPAQLERSVCQALALQLCLAAAGQLLLQASLASHQVTLHCLCLCVCPAGLFHCSQILGYSCAVTLELLFSLHSTVRGSCWWPPCVRCVHG